MKNLKVHKRILHRTFSVVCGPVFAYQLRTRIDEDVTCLRCLIEMQKKEERKNAKAH